MFLSWCCIYSFVFRRPVVKVIQHRENEPSPKTRDQTRLSPRCCRSRNYTVWTYGIEIQCTSSIACNEHLQTVMGQRKMQNLSHDWPIVEPLLWAKDGPMSKRYVGPFKIYNHGPVVRRPMGQWRANVYVLSGCPTPEVMIRN